MFYSNTNICIQNRINYENKYFCAVCLYCQCRQREKKEEERFIYIKKTHGSEIIIKPPAKTNITMQEAA